MGEALNVGKGDDRMSVARDAADEAPPEEEAALRATGDWVRNYHGGSLDVWLDKVVSHTSQAFLAVSMGCVRCNDHKYDPIPQEAYYEMRAIFEPYHVRTDRVPGELDTKKMGMPRAYDRAPAAKTYFLKRGDERLPDKDRVMRPGVPKVLGGEYRAEAVKLPRLAYQPAKREFVKKEMMAAE